MAEMSERPARMQDKVVVVTGGGDGIGRAISILFAREGARVSVADIDPDSARSTAAAIGEFGGSALAVAADVRDSGCVENLVRQTETAFGGLDVLVNNAGVATDGDVVELSEAEWQRILDVNLTGVFLCCKYAIPAMRRRGGGSIVNVASIAARVGGSVSCVCPGHVDTALTFTLKDPAVREALIQKYPIGRLGTAEEIAAAVLFLASDEASFITGTELIVDGGYTAQ